MSDDLIKSFKGLNKKEIEEHAVKCALYSDEKDCWYKKGTRKYVWWMNAYNKALEEGINEEMEALAELERGYRQDRI
jgi:hypothetical protein